MKTPKKRMNIYKLKYTLKKLKVQHFLGLFIAKKAFGFLLSKGLFLYL
jgi:hypothetical protein